MRLHESQWRSLTDVQFIKSCIFYYKSPENPHQYYNSHDNSYQYYKSCENPYQYYKSCENLYQVLQVTCAASERAMVHMMKSKLYRKNITRLLPLTLLLVLHTHNNTDGNKLVIFLV